MPIKYRLNIMAIKRYKPTSPGRRNMTGLDYKKMLSGDKPTKSLMKGGKRSKGRANSGRISVRHKGGGHKRKFRDIDFKFDKLNIPAKVETVEYDPNRTAFISRVLYADGERRYIVAIKDLKVGSTFIVSESGDHKVGNRMHLKNIPVGLFVCNVEIKPGSGAKLGRSAGSYLQVSAHSDNFTSLKMPSGEIRRVPNFSFATIGEISNQDHKLVKLGKAGRSRWKGKRPTVRGSAMNPVDHPHGGGEGRQGIGLRRGPKTRTGKLAYGVKTRKRNKYSNSSIISRRKSKRQGK